MYVNIFSFSGVYPDEDFWRMSDDPAGNADVRFFDLSDIGGTNGYLSDEARALILRRTASAPVRAVNFIDNGNTHYMTDILCGRVTEPFVLVLIDHHTDMQPPAFGGLESCGSWVRSALEQNPMLKGVLIVGPGEESALEDCLRAGYAGKPVILLPEAAAGAEAVRSFVTELSDMCGTDGVYISIDKDILDRDEAVTNWDQGGMSSDALADILRELVRYAGSRLAGVDICGECPPRAQYRDDIVPYDAAVRQNDEINIKLLDILRSYL